MNGSEALRLVYVIPVYAIICVFSLIQAGCESIINVGEKIVGLQ